MMQKSQLKFALQKEQAMIMYNLDSHLVISSASGNIK